VSRLLPLLRLPLQGLLLAAVSLSALDLRGAEPDPAEVTALLTRSADLHLTRPSGIAVTDWIIAPFYDGLLRLALVTDEPKYLAAVLAFGRHAGWSPRWRPYHADDQAVGHAWLDVYLLDRSRGERLGPIKAHLDHAIGDPLAAGTAPGRIGHDRWTWCDALYMAPPTLARLYSATGDTRYLAFLDREYRQAHGLLYDRDDHLFYRDTRFIGQRTPNGRKVFWSRGNGWVFGGLALLLEHLPPTYPNRGFYGELFRDMSRSILAAQQPDGLWRPSLLDPDQVPTGETSGSGLLLFGLAWGLNHGLLDPAIFRSAVLRGWRGLVTRVQPDGFVGFVQPPGSAPGSLAADSNHDFGTGAFLLAGSELLRVLGGAAAVDRGALLRRADAILAASDRAPRAHARLGPEGDRDLAWENDQVAFRLSDPARRDGAAGGGIGVWVKRNPDPVIIPWKAPMPGGHTEVRSGFNVGDSLGCGGTALWLGNRLVTAGACRFRDVYWTGHDLAEVRAIYEYPGEFRGGKIWEYKTIRLRLGQRLCEVSSTFSSVGAKNLRPIPDFDLPVVVGLVTQSPGAATILDPRAGFAAVNDRLDGRSFYTGMVADPAHILRMEHSPHAGEPRGSQQALVFLRPSAGATVKYRAGFAWAGDGEITTAEEWTKHLRAGRLPAVHTAPAP
jgi:rhamnogalacturonyl hydrolase YesR